MIPICEVHRHLGGSIPPKTVYELTKASHDLSLKKITKMMTIGKNECLPFREFLNKFSILDTIEWTEQAINIMVRDVCSEVSNQVDVAFLSLSLNKYVKHGWDPKEIAIYIGELFNQYCKENNIKIGLLLSIRYDSPRESQEKYAELISDGLISNIFCGIDLVGDEQFLDIPFHSELLQPWYESNKLTRAHVGEVPGTDASVFKCISEMPITNVAHGIYASPEALKIANDRQITFDLCLNSNKVIQSWNNNLECHPIINMLKSNCSVTLSSDDPSIFSTDINDEFDVARKICRIDEETIEKIKEKSYEIAKKYLITQT